MRANRIYQGDCLELMRCVSSGSIDMILCDLPYGVTDNAWDSRIDLDLLWTEYRRLIRPNGAIVLTACQPFTSMLVMSNAKWFRHEWIWRKSDATGHLNARHMPMRKHENILVFASGRPTYHPQGLRPCFRQHRAGIRSSNWSRADKATVQRFTGYPVSVLDFGRDRERIHPTQKPVALFEYLVRTYTRPGELVMDNCMGSGTTAIACMRSGRRFIGFEREAAYWRLATDRIAREKAA